MTKDKNGVSAAELMARLQSDPDFQARAKEKEQARLESIAANTEAAAPLLRELAAAGFAVNTLAHLRRLHYPAAIPLLVDWLPRMQNIDVKQDVVRCLSVPYARPLAVAPLLAEFRSAADDGPAGLRWVIGNALEVLADDAVLDDVIDLATDRKYGKAREMTVLALGNMRDPHAVDVLMDLLHDEEVTGHAIMALGKLRPLRARDAVEPFLRHPTAWIRKEAAKTIAKIDKQQVRRRH